MWFGLRRCLHDLNTSLEVSADFCLAGQSLKIFQLKPKVPETIVKQPPEAIVDPEAIPMTQTALPRSDTTTGANGIEIGIGSLGNPVVEDSSLLTCFQGHLPRDDNVAKGPSSWNPSALLNLSGRQLTALVPPTVPELALCEAMRSQKITSNDRGTILSNQDTVWGR